jgi:hypothetical protein
MNTISVSHHDRLVALAAPHRFWLAAHIEALPDGHPRKRLVAYMVLYARDVLIGELPGPYNDDDAERFARLALADRPLQATRSGRGCSTSRSTSSATSRAGRRTPPAAFPPHSAARRWRVRALTPPASPTVAYSIGWC